VAIQSTSALNAYLTTASTAPVSAGTPESTTSADEGTQAQGSASAGLSQEPGRSSVSVATLAQGDTDQAANASSTVQPSLPALYGRNARSVAGGMRAGSISLIA
jgi:hypothetical protein